MQTTSFVRCQLSFLCLSTLLSVLSSCGMPKKNKTVTASSIKGFYLSTSLWSQRNLEVCWENMPSTHETERYWVEKKITNSWQKYSALTFRGWGSCDDLRQADIRILIADQGAHTKGLGRNLKNKKNGMVLNFTFHRWNNICKKSENRKDCIESIAVHEFGHALGLAHEHNRDDRDRDCVEKKQGGMVDVKVGRFDRDSIMNYCYSSSYSNRLSYGDIRTIQQMYGKPRDTVASETPSSRPVEPPVRRNLPQNSSKTFQLVQFEVERSYQEFRSYPKRNYLEFYLKNLSEGKVKTKRVLTMHCADGEINRVAISKYLEKNDQRIVIPNDCEDDRVHLITFEAKTSFFAQPSQIVLSGQAMTRGAIKDLNQGRNT